MTGESIHTLVRDLFGIRTGITGDGLRSLLRRIKEELPDLRILEVPSGTPLLDWHVPDEWNVRNAYIADESGKRIIDWQEHSLHLVQYSEPVRGRFSWGDLKSRIHTLPDHPEWIPYRTSYYVRTWGFCCRHSVYEELDALGDDREFEVVIDADLHAGSLSYGELVIPGKSPYEILISAHVCHPQLANDNAASVALAVRLAQQLLSKKKPEHTFRFVFAPGTIGAICWLENNRDRVSTIRHGLILATLGDDGSFVYKKSRAGSFGSHTIGDDVCASALANHPHEIREFEPFGYDERQFCSPGFNLPVGRLSRTPHGEYPQYHTSADDLEFVTPENLEESFKVLSHVVAELDGIEDGELQMAATRKASGTIYRNAQPYGEPQMGRRGLYAALGGLSEAPLIQKALMWVLNLSDGSFGIEDIVEVSGLERDHVLEAVDRLVNAGLLS